MLKFLRTRLFYLVLPVSVALLGAGLFATGIALALRSTYGQPLASPEAPLRVREPQPEQRRTRDVRLVALGDSIAQGTGDTVRGGLAARVGKLLEGRGLVVSVVNLGVGGSETSELLAQLERPETERQVSQADVLLVSIGGNDLSHAIRPEIRATGTARSLTQAYEGAAKNFGAILRKLRRQNPKAAVRMLGFYNPFEVSGAGEAEARRELLRWNTALETSALESHGAIVIPSSDLFLGRRDFFATDQFHPGPRGYEELARRLVATLPEFSR